MDSPDGTVDTNLPANAGVTCSVPGLGRFHVPWDNKAHVLQLVRTPAAAAAAVALVVSNSVRPQGWVRYFTATEVCVPKARALQQDKPLLAITRKSLHVVTKTQCNQKKKESTLKSMKCT